MHWGRHMSSAERDPRVPGFRRGLLEYDDCSSACLIENVSTRGFLLECLDEFVVGQKLQLTSTFGPGETMQCQIEVRHVDGSSVGAVIMKIDERSARLCREMIEEYYAVASRRRETQR